MQGTWFTAVSFSASVVLASAHPAFAQNVTIGIAGPMTGQYATFGQQLQNGADLAIADLNAAGGVNGKKPRNESGVKEKLYEAYTQGERDFNALVSRLKSASIDFVYVGGYHTEAGLILRQMREQGMTTQMMSGDAMATTEFWSITGSAGQ